MIATVRRRLRAHAPASARRRRRATEMPRVRAKSRRPPLLLWIAVRSRLLFSLPLIQNAIARTACSSKIQKHRSLAARRRARRSCARVRVFNQRHQGHNQVATRLCAHLSVFIIF